MLCNNRFIAKDYFLGRFDQDDKHGYILLSGGDQRKKVICNPKFPKDTSLVLRDVGGVEHTAIRCRRRFLSALKASNKASQCFNLLLEVLADNDIRNFFYDLWLANHNHQARKINRAVMCAMREAMNRSVRQESANCDIISGARLG